MDGTLKKGIIVALCLLTSLSVGYAQNKPVNGKYDPPIDISMVLGTNDQAQWFHDGDTYENNIYTRRWEKDLGIKYRFLWTVPASQLEDKMNLMIASGDLPDMMNISRSNFEKLQNAGKLADITTAVNTYASDYTRSFLTGDFAAMRDAVTKGGRMYGLANGMSFHDTTQGIWIRADWLKNLKMSPPRTLPELEAVMDAFTNKDPDQNGKNDTYAIALKGADLDSITWGIRRVFFHAFGSFPGYWVKDSKGALEDGLFGPEFRGNTKTALSKLAEYYSKGYIKKDFGLLDETKLQEELINGRCGILFGDTWDPWGTLMLQKDKDPSIDWLPIAVPTVGGKPGKMGARAVDIFTVNVVNKSFKNPEAMVLMLNLFHQLNNNPKTMEFAVYNTQPADNNQMFLAFPLQIYNPKFNFEAYTYIADAFKTGSTANLCEAFKSFYDQSKAYEATGDKAGWPSYRTYTEGGVMALTKYYLDKKLFVFDEYIRNPTQFMIQNNPTIKKLYDEMFFKVVMGTAKISEFDKFITQYDRIYLPTSTREVNDWYKAKGK